MAEEVSLTETALKEDCVTRLYNAMRQDCYEYPDGIDGVAKAWGYSKATIYAWLDKEHPRKLSVAGLVEFIEVVGGVHTIQVLVEIMDTFKRFKIKMLEEKAVNGRELREIKSKLLALEKAQRRR